jgi:hypothetical protein
MWAGLANCLTISLFKDSTMAPLNMICTCFSIPDFFTLLGMDAMIYTQMLESFLKLL